MKLKILRERFQIEESFACFLALKLIYLKKGKAKVEMPLTANLLNANGVVMGGAIISLADFAAPYAAMTLITEKEVVATTSISVQFLKPAILEDGGLLAVALSKEPRTEEDAGRIKKLIDVEVEVFSKKTKNKKVLYKATFAVLPKTIMERVINEN